MLDVAALSSRCIFRPLPYLSIRSKEGEAEVLCELLRRGVFFEGNLQIRHGLALYTALGRG